MSLYTQSFINKIQKSKHKKEEEKFKKKNTNS